MLINIARLNNNKDNSPKDQVFHIEDFTTLLTNFNISPKNQAKAFSAGFLGGQRNSANNPHFKSISLIVLDIDKYPGSIQSLETILKKDLGKYKFIAHSTASYTLETPKIRVVVFLTNEIKIESYQNIAKRFIASLSKDLQASIDDGASTSAARIFYLPTKLKADNPTWTMQNEGTMILNPAVFDMGDLKPSTKNNDPLLKLALYRPLEELSEEKISEWLDSYDIETTTEKEWREVGFALHHQFQGERKGLLIWNSWSKTDTRIGDNGHKKYQGLDDLIKKWRDTKNECLKPITFATIIERIKAQRPGHFKETIEIPWKDTKGKYQTPYFTRANFEILLNHYNIEIKYDEARKRLNIWQHGERVTPLRSAITHIRLLCNDNGLSINLVEETIWKIGNENRFHSFEKWIKDQINPENGKDLFAIHCAGLTMLPKYEQFKKQMLWRSLLQIVHLTCFNNDSVPKKGEMVLVLQGEQGIQKSTWIRSLVPSYMYDYAHSVMGFDPSNDMQIKTTLEHVIVELGELGSTFRKADMEVLKGFLSNNQDKVNIKYIADAEESRRKTIFFATVNDENFLSDQTGNRRLVVLPVLKCDHMHFIDSTLAPDARQKKYDEFLGKLYAYVFKYIEENPNEVYYPTADEMVFQTRLNKKYELLSPVIELIEDNFDLSKHTPEKSNLRPKQLVEEGYQPYSATQVLKKLGWNVNNSNLTKNARDVAKLLTHHFKFKYLRDKGRWYLPPLITTTTPDF